MTLTPRIVTEAIRQRLGDVDSRRAAKYIIQIPECLKNTARLIAADPYLRQLLVTDPLVTDFPIMSGYVSLEDGYDDFQFLMEYFNLGNIYYVTVPAPEVTVSASTNFFSIPTDYETLADGDRVYFTVSDGGELPTPLEAGIIYYLKNFSIVFPPGEGSTQLSLTAGGAVIDITDGGTGTLTMIKRDVTITTLGLPLQPLASPQQATLTNYLSSVFGYYYIQGNKLYPLAPNTVGNIAFSVPKFPANLSELPDSTECEAIFLQEMMNLIGVPVQEP